MWSISQSAGKPGADKSATFDGPCTSKQALPSYMQPGTHESPASPVLLSPEKTSMPLNIDLMAARQHTDCQP